MKKILLTGGSGNLGQAIKNSNLFSNLLTPSSKVLDITNQTKIKKYLKKHKINTIIHSAALARMAQCESNPDKCVRTNIIGTANLVATISKSNIRFIYISSDGVYPGTSGNYSEVSPTVPYNKYGWSKLGGECAVNLLSNYAIIRTSFFDPKNIKFDSAATDAFSSKLPIDKLVKKIHKITNSTFIGTINIGSKKLSDFHRYSKFKKIVKIKFNKILKLAKIPLAKDASLNTKKWQRIKWEKK